MDTSLLCPGTTTLKESNMTYRYTAKENSIINNAIKILRNRVCDSELMNTTKDVKQYCQLAIANEPDE